MTAALDAWKRGTPDRNVPKADKPSLFVVDSERVEEPELLAFEIVAETPAPTSRCLTAQLTFAETDEPVLARLYIFGIDPLFIYRQADYDMFSHWEHKMEPNDRVESAGRTKHTNKALQAKKHEH